MCEFSLVFVFTATTVHKRREGGKKQWMNVMSVLVSSHKVDALTLMAVIYGKRMGAELSWLNGLMAVLLSVTYNTCS